MEKLTNTGILNFINFNFKFLLVNETILCQRKKKDQGERKKRSAACHCILLIKSICVRASQKWDPRCIQDAYNLIVH